MRITSIENNKIDYTSSENVTRKKREVIPTNQIIITNSKGLENPKTFNISKIKVDLEEKLDLAKLERIKKELESTDLTSELLSEVLIKSFLNDRG